MVCYGSPTYTSFKDTPQNRIGVIPRTRFMEHTYLNRAGWTLARCCGVLSEATRPEALNPPAAGNVESSQPSLSQDLPSAEVMSALQVQTGPGGRIKAQPPCLKAGQLCKAIPAPELLVRLAEASVGTISWLSFSLCPIYPPTPHSWSQGRPPVCFLHVDFRLFPGKPGLRHFHVTNILLCPIYMKFIGKIHLPQHKI